MTRKVKTFNHSKKKKKKKKKKIKKKRKRSNYPHWLFLFFYEASHLESYLVTPQKPDPPLQQQQLLSNYIYIYILQIKLIHRVRIIYTDQWTIIVP